MLVDPSGAEYYGCHLGLGSLSCSHVKSILNSSITFDWLVAMLRGNQKTGSNDPGNYHVLRNGNILATQTRILIIQIYKEHKLLFQLSYSETNSVYQLKETSTSKALNCLVYGTKICGTKPWNVYLIIDFVPSEKKNYPLIKVDAWE